MKVINQMLSNRGLKQLDTSYYKEVFCFPVKRFYERIGFDLKKESIETASEEYMSGYRSHENQVCLSVGASFVLDAIRQKGIKQYILSACAQEDLMRITNHFNLVDNFEKIYGADDICAHGKIGRGQMLIKNHSLNPQRTLLIGDTLHDAEVAKALGIKSILYSGGHNSHNLLSKESRVISSLEEILTI